MSLSLGVDLDGVVCDFAKAANEWLADQMGVTPIDVDKWDWYRGYGDEVLPLWDQLWEREVPNGFFLTVEEVPGACDALDTLRRSGHKLVFCTARPMCSGVDTEAWLEMHDFKGHPLFVTANAKAKQHLGVDLLIDDKVETVNKYRALGKDAVLFKQPWNVTAWHKVPSVYDWNEVIELVGALDG